MKIIKIEKHGKIMSVQEDLNGKHKEHCLCYQKCNHFNPGKDNNCPIAQKLFEFDVENGVTTPVWECVKYEEDLFSHLKDAPFFNPDKN